jgi:hypothetical protein
MKRGKSYQAHTPIKLAHGEQLLTIPTRGELLKITETPVDYSQKWIREHLKSLEVAFAKSKNFKPFFPEIEGLLNSKFKFLGELTIRSVLWGFWKVLTDEPADNLSAEAINQRLSSSPFRLKKIFLASASGLPAPEKGGANDWILKLCKFAGADEYFYGSTSHDSYMDLEKFKTAGVRLALQNWKGEEYRQQYPKLGFLPNLSILDLVFNEDLNRRQKILK